MVPTFFRLASFSLILIFCVDHNCSLYNLNMVRTIIFILAAATIAPVTISRPLPASDPSSNNNLDHELNPDPENKWLVYFQ